MGTAVATLRIAVVEDHPAVAAGIECLFEAETGFEVVGQAGRYRDAIELAERVLPDVIVMDMHLTGGNGLLLAQELLQRQLTRGVVIFTAFADDGVALAALIAGASAVVPKAARGHELVDAVRNSARGRASGPRVTIDALVEAGGLLEPDDLAILAMLVHGTTPPEIGDVLGVHERELAGRRRRMLKALVSAPA